MAVAVSRVDFSTRGFQSPRHKLADPMVFFTGLALFLFLRDVTIKFLWYPLARRVLCGRDAAGADVTTPTPKAISKFMKYCWHALAYAAFFLWGLTLLTQQPWSFDVASIWEGYPHEGAEKLPFRLFMLLQMAWYAHGFVESLLVDSSRRDFYLLLGHHVLAVCMLGGSYWGNGHRCAVSVCVEQDFSDVVMYLSKAIKECRYFAVTQRRWVTTVLAVGIWASWLVTRIVILGWILIQAYATHVPSGVLHPQSGNFDWLSVYLVAQLTVFWGLQLVWWIGICTMVWTQITKGSYTDIWHDSNRHQKS